MGREVRMVPPWWHHPVYFNDFNKKYNPLPLMDGFLEDMQNWKDERDELVRRIGAESNPNVLVDLRDSLKWHEDSEPDPRKYMPDFPVELRTHYQMYETCSEGTPISPVFDTPEKLARWLADNKASAFADSTATYNEWLSMIRGPGWAPSAVGIPGKGLVSGVVMAG